MNQVNKTLTRSSLKNNNPTKIILVGSGAIENSYQPLKAALNIKPHIELNGSNVGIYEKETMHGLANAYFTYKAARDYFLSKLCDSQNNQNINDYITQDIIRTINALPDTRAEIANQYRNTNLTLWKDIQEYLHSQDWNTTAVITTNWDETLWNDIKIKNLVQLHGRAQYEKTLIMPTEFTMDEKIFDLSIKAFKIDDGKKVHERLGEVEFRRVVDNCTKGDASELLKNAHFIAQNWFVEAKEIVFIGIAMNIYDAELNSVVFSGAKNNWESVTNWNTDPKSDSVIGVLTLTNPESIIKLGREK